MKTGISCYDCIKLGTTCAAMRTPSRECFVPKKGVKMKKKICDLKPGTPFKHKEQIFILDDCGGVVNPINGKTTSVNWDIDFKNGDRTPVTVCKRIRKSDIKERK